MSNSGRSLLKKWQDKRSSPNYCIKWYQGVSPDNIRIHIMGVGIGERNLWPQSREVALMWWENFKKDPKQAFTDMWKLGMREVTD